jgi:hypothetical protein
VISIKFSACCTEPVSASFPDAGIDVGQYYFRHLPEKNASNRKQIFSCACATDIEIS